MTILARSIALALAGALSLAACADKSVGLSPTVEVASLSELPAPSATVAQVINPGEPLLVTVVGSDLLTGEYLTDSSGAIELPLIGTVEVGGLDRAQAGALIAARLRDRYIRNPQVIIRPQTVQVPSISVGGEVERAGTYPATSSRTLTRAINNAGGLSEFAKSDDVLILRTVDGQRYIGVYNIEAIQRGNYDDPLVYPDDVITVGDSPFRRNLQAVIGLIPLLSTAAILIDNSGN
jgi:polysaccharide export outer membrane protein